MFFGECMKKANIQKWVDEKHEVINDDGSAA